MEKGAITKKERPSFFIASEGSDESAIEAGLKWLLQLATDSRKSSALLAVPTKFSLEGSVSQNIGEANKKKLAKNEEILYSSTLKLSLLTERSTFSSWNGPVLAVYPTKKLLDKIDGLNGVTDVLAVLGDMEEIQFWIDTWSANELNNPSAVKTAKLHLNPVVEEALKSLTEHVNENTGIRHPNNRSRAIDLFKRLLAGSEKFEPNKVRAWLVSQASWKPEDADEVEKVAAKVLAGKDSGKRKRCWAENILDIWRERAKEKQDSGG